MRAAWLLVLGSACTGGADDDSGGGGGGASGARVALRSPEPGDGSYDGSFELAWEVAGLELDAAALGGADAPGRGHVHVYVDGQLVEETAASGTRVQGLGAGAHTLRIRLAENDHDELGSGDEVDVEVRAPSIRLSAPAEGAVLDASSVPLVFAVDDFALVDAIGEPDRFGEGHVRVFVDGELRDIVTDPLLGAATGLAAGTHTVRVALHRNDGVAVDPPVEVERSVTVPVGVKGVYWDRSAFGAPYPSATVPISLSVSAFVLYDRELGRPPAEGEGHLHLFLDGAWLDATATTSRVLQNVAAGLHVFEARLVSNDGFELPVIDRMWVDVAQDRADVTVSYPGPSWVMGPDFTLVYAAENFTLDAAAMGGANASATGHAQVWIDGVLQAETASTSVPLSGLAPGTHTLRVQLANNDRTPVEPPVYAEFPIVVE